MPCREPHAEGATLWVTFPFDASLTVGQPEVLARVVRAVVVRAAAASVAEKRKNGNGNGHHANGNGSNGHGGNGNGNGHKNGNGNGHHGDGAAVFRSPSATEAAALESGREVSDEHADAVADTASAADRGVEVAPAEEFLTLLALRFEIDPARQRAAGAISPSTCADSRPPLWDDRTRMDAKKRFPAKAAAEPRRCAHGEFSKPSARATPWRVPCGHT